MFSYIKRKLAEWSVPPADPVPEPVRVQYVVSLEANCEDPVLAVLDTEPEARQFVHDLRTHKIVRDKHVADTEDRINRDLGPWGYSVTVIEDRLPTKHVQVADDEPFDPALPLFPVEASAA